MLAIPMLGTAGLEFAALALGLFATTGFVVWIPLPARTAARIPLFDIPAAAGLLLSIAAVGGVLFPWLYAHIASAWGADTAWRLEGGLALLLAPLAFAARA